MDLLWFLWAGRNSPIFGRDRMTTFERRLIRDESSWTEAKNAYYTFYQDPAVCDALLKEFGLEGPHCHIVNGHIPVKSKKGESPIKAGGLLFIIDGGISKAYQKQTGIGGYTLIYNSHHLALAQHKPYELAKQDFSKNAPTMQIVEIMPRRLTVGDTDNGKQVAQQIEELTELLKAYRNGEIKEK